MARSPIPDPMSRRHLLETQIDAAQATRIAEAYIEQGRVSEAVAFLEKAGDSERLEALCAEAVGSGDVFGLKAACAALGREPSEDEWRRAAAAAETTGKLRYASTAQRQVKGEG